MAGKRLIWRRMDTIRSAVCFSLNLSEGRVERGAKLLTDINDSLKVLSMNDAVLYKDGVDYEENRADRFCRPVSHSGDGR